MIFGLASLTIWSFNASLIGYSFEFLLGPSLYFYIKSLVYKDFKLETRHSIHLVPFALYWLLVILRFNLQDASIKQELLTSEYVRNGYESIFISCSIYIHFIAYSIASLIVLRNYRLGLKKLYSSIENLRLSWLGFVTVGFIIVWAIGFVNFLLHLNGIELFFPSFVFVLCVFAFANVIVFRGLKQPEIFSGIEEKPKYKDSALSRSEIEKYLELLKLHMKSEKPYLSPSLSINELATRASINPRYLSQIINESLGMNFFDFVGKYRIEEAKNKMLESSRGNRNILQILLEVGFNSKSAFYRAFKKNTGMTPSEFIRQKCS